MIHPEENKRLRITLPELFQIPWRTYGTPWRKNISSHVDELKLCWLKNGGSLHHHYYRSWSMPRCCQAGLEVKGLQTEQFKDFSLFFLSYFRILCLKCQCILLEKCRTQWFSCIFKCDESVRIFLRFNVALLKGGHNQTNIAKLTHTCRICKSILRQQTI